MPSSLALYRLICLFPSSFYKRYYFGGVWKIILSHTHTAKLIEFSDKNGVFTISILNETIPTVNEFNILTDTSSIDFEPQSIFHQDILNLLNLLVSNNVILPNGITAGYIA
ncbi:hypothetical protein MXB_5273 [Myxobolus squamalis]|nr:hypothetical protein MXB_5273 [Myxobolus squamalis]